MNQIAIVLLTSLMSGSPETALNRDQLVRQAESGDITAIHTLCYAHSYGSGLPKDYGHAFLWCEKGAQMGHANSQTLLAELYHFGFHVPKSEEDARRWYSSAAEKGHLHAQFMLGRVILASASTISDAQEACRWFVRAADSGYQKAKDQLAELDDSWYRHYSGSPPRVHFCERHRGL